MKTPEEIITDTFRFIPDSLFENKTTEKSIYINFEKAGYKHDWTGTVFMNKAGKVICHYEIKHPDIKATKAETLAHFLEETKKRELIKALLAQRQRTI